MLLRGSSNKIPKTKLTFSGVCLQSEYVSIVNFYFPSVFFKDLEYFVKMLSDRDGLISSYSFLLLGTA